MNGEKRGDQICQSAVSFPHIDILNACRPTSSATYAYFGVEIEKLRTRLTILDPISYISALMAQLGEANPE